MTEDTSVVSAHVLARQTLAKRYAWEIDALVGDIVNKVEMEILTDTASIRSYVSNLLRSHPRVKEEGRAAETLMCSENRGAQAEDKYNVHVFLESLGSDHPGGMREDAYYAMGADLLMVLTTKHHMILTVE